MRRGRGDRRIRKNGRCFSVRAGIFLNTQKTVPLPKIKCQDVTEAWDGMVPAVGVLQAVFLLDYLGQISQRAVLHTRVGRVEAQEAQVHVWQEYRSRADCGGPPAYTQS